MSENTTPDLLKNEEKGQYEIHVDGQLAGYATFQDRAGVRVLPHTVVHEEFQGRGLSKPLIAFALDDARSDGLKVIPQCSAVARFIEKNPDYADLVA
ncbi:GNAT family N-acetyltransferase [Corynebacterium auris]|uniref:GNAT family N-acetyltransferase n=1 Tax=Corynebacterium auris TaxID=44750 RepID=UPI0025B55735|nr:GNAT family N-acetyltransferase [Corynebacterium auris]WJY68710.1 hypothetical protein CAURIS_09150 [Corynebacterium auris]